MPTTMSFVIPNRGHPRGGVAEAPQLSAPVSATQSNQKSRENIAQYDNQLQSLFFAVLPPEIRTAILSMLLYEGSPTQHIAHFYDGSTRYADGFVRSRCVQQPDSFKHVAEHRNMVKSPWRDGHWHCGRLSTRHSTWRRLKRRLAAKSAAAAAVLYPSPSTCPPPRQSVSLSSGTWSFSPLPTEGSEAPAGSSGGAPHALQFMTAAAANAGPDGPDYPGAENALCSPVPLLLSCRRLHDETADVLYASMTFIGLKPVRYFFREIRLRGLGAGVSETGSAEGARYSGCQNLCLRANSGTDRTNAPRAG
ncbi:uncharacterized protein B0I36DRAFT_352339 [Microdochium trichocladiopsis]|uniref:Uncharacterized protein n=1 Tax=Microdochium trichocladiopsis TaxID=1682393 RepID=A0A9P8XZC2_9PEZI|nr:uncharacterized protein B0I36DRAFT_352339 [Microdochium trichocladiopsis]KAH7026490.1 hypothetical protein B0I36DRAFT_352339 [Microdochium trichocladiopsis]